MLPKSLTQGSVVGITCPSGYVAESRVAHATVVLERWGFRVKHGSTIGKGQFYLAGTDEERLADLQAMMDDPGIDAILMGRGGYGMSRIIDQLDLTGFSRHPKWVCGFSDITVILNHLQARLQMPSLHSPMCGAFKTETENERYLLSLYDALSGKPQALTAPPYDYNREGVATALLTGGNLCILAHLTGSVSEVDTTGKILFIEDVGEYLYNTDRMLMNLKRAGKLDKLAGLAVGSFTDTQDTERPFGQSVEQIIIDKVREYDYPVCFGLPVGHQEVNHTLVMGAPYKLEVAGNGCRLTPQ